MFGSRKALLKQTSYTNFRSVSNANVFPSGATPQDVATVTGDRVQVCDEQGVLLDRRLLDTKHLICTHAVQVALLAATRDREAAQVALAEAKTRQEETTEVLDTLSVMHTLFALEQLLVHCYILGQHCKLVFQNWDYASAGAELVHERAGSAAEGEE